MKRVGDLELNQDLAFQYREWAVQRGSRWVLAVFVIAAALGAFGGGPLTHARAGAPGSPVWILPSCRGWWTARTWSATRGGRTARLRSPSWPAVPTRPAR